MITVANLALLLTFSCAVLGLILTAYAFKYRASAAIRFCFGLMFYGNAVVLLNLAADGLFLQVLGVASILLYGPALWWLVVTQITGAQRFFHPAHLLPAVLCLIVGLLATEWHIHLMAINAVIFLVYLGTAARILRQHRHALSERNALLWLSGYLFLGFWYSGWTLFSYAQYMLPFSVILEPEMVRLLQAIVTQTTALALTWWAITRPELYLDSQPPEASPTPASDFDQEVYDRLERLFDDQQFFTQDDLSLEIVADQLAVTPRELSNAVNRCSGSGFRTYLRQHRIAFAKSLLANPSFEKRSILDIALEAGYSNKSTFNIAFKAEVNITPSEYRTEALSR